MAGRVAAVAVWLVVSAALLPVPAAGQADAPTFDPPPGSVVTDGSLVVIDGHEGYEAAGSCLRGGQTIGVAAPDAVRIDVGGFGGLCLLRVGVPFDFGSARYQVAGPTTVLCEDVFSACGAPVLSPSLDAAVLPASCPESVTCDDWSPAWVWSPTHRFSPALVDLPGSSRVTATSDDGTLLLLRDDGGSISVLDRTASTVRTLDGLTVCDGRPASSEQLTGAGLVLLIGRCGDAPPELAALIVDGRTGAVVRELRGLSTGGFWQLSQDGGELVSRWGWADLATGAITDWRRPGVYPELPLPAISANGEHAVFVQQPGGVLPGGLYVEDLRTGVRRLGLDTSQDLTHAHQVAGVSDDGQRVLYSLQTDGPSRAEQAYLLDMATGAQVPVSRDHRGNLSTSRATAVACDAGCTRVAFTGATFPDGPTHADILVDASRALGGAAGGAPRAATMDLLGMSDTLALPSATTADEATTLSVAIAAAERRAGGEVILARNDAFADSLASGVLQAQGPLLLTDGAALSAEVEAQLLRIGPQRVTILGGEAAVSRAVEDRLRFLQVDVRRIAGASRIATAVQVAEAAGPAPAAIVLARAFGSGAGDGSDAFVDALAAGALAAERGWPVLLTPTDALDEAVAGYLAAHPGVEVVVVGGTAAVSAGVEQDIAARGHPVRRLAGGDRFTTAVAIAEAFGDGDAGRTGGATVVEATSATSWAGGLLTARRAAVQDAPVVLAAGDDLPPPTEAWLRSAPDVQVEEDEVVVTCVAGRVTCEESRLVLGLPAAVTAQLDPPPGELLPAGGQLRVGLSPAPADAVVLVEGDCVDGGSPQPEEGTVPVADVLPSVTCGLTIFIQHGSGTTQTLGASYLTDPDALLIASGSLCFGHGSALDADGRTLGYVAGPPTPSGRLAGQACPGYVESPAAPESSLQLPRTAVFLDLPTLTTTSIPLPSLYASDAQEAHLALTPGGTRMAISTPDCQTALLPDGTYGVVCTERVEVVDRSGGWQVLVDLAAGLPGPPVVAYRVSDQPWEDEDHLVALAVREDGTTELHRIDVAAAAVVPAGAPLVGGAPAVASRTGVLAGTEGWWDPVVGGPLVPWPPEVLAERVHAVDLSMDGDRALIEAFGTRWLWQRSRGSASPLMLFSCVRLSPSGRFVLTDALETVDGPQEPLYDVDAGAPAPLARNPQAGCDSVHLSADDATLVSAGAALHVLAGP